MNFDFSMILTFLTIVECQSLSKAAARLQISRQAVSRQLIRLEETVGTALLLRSHSGLSLTTVGNIYYLYCKDFLEKYEHLESDLALLRHQKEVNTVLRIGILYGEYWSSEFFDLIYRFQDHNPQISLLWECHEPHELGTLLSEHKLDLLLVSDFDFQKTDEMEAFPLWQNTACIYIRRDNPLVHPNASIKDFLGEPCFIWNSTPGSGHALASTFIHHWKSRGILFTNVKALPNFSSILLSLESGKGIAVHSSTSILSQNPNLIPYPLGLYTDFSCVRLKSSENPCRDMLISTLQNQYQVLDKEGSL